MLQLVTWTLGLIKLTVKPGLAQASAQWDHSSSPLKVRIHVLKSITLKKCTSLLFSDGSVGQCSLWQVEDRQAGHRLHAA